MLMYSVKAKARDMEVDGTLMITTSSVPIMVSLRFQLRTCIGFLDVVCAAQYNGVDYDPASYSCKSGV